MKKPDEVFRALAELYELNRGLRGYRMPDEPKPHEEAPVSDPDDERPARARPKEKPSRTS